MARPLAPGPFNLPSLKKESGVADPHLHLVPGSGPVWGGASGKGKVQTLDSRAAPTACCGGTGKAGPGGSCVSTHSSTIAAVARAAEERDANRLRLVRANADAANIAEKEAARALEELGVRAAAANERAAQMARKATAVKCHERDAGGADGGGWTRTPLGTTGMPHVWSRAVCLHSSASIADTDRFMWHCGNLKACSRPLRSDRSEVWR